MTLSELRICWETGFSYTCYNWQSDIEMDTVNVTIWNFLLHNCSWKSVPTQISVAIVWKFRATDDGIEPTLVITGITRNKTHNCHVMWINWVLMRSCLVYYTIAAPICMLSSYVCIVVHLFRKPAAPPKCEQRQQVVRCQSIPLVSTRRVRRHITCARKEGLCLRFGVPYFVSDVITVPLSSSSSSIKADPYDRSDCTSMATTSHWALCCTMQCIG